MFIDIYTFLFASYVCSTVCHLFISSLIPDLSLDIFLPFVLNFWKSELYVSYERVSLYKKTCIQEQRANKLLKAAYREVTGCKNFSRYKSAHLKSLIKSIRYSQALQLKMINTETSELRPCLKEVEQTFIKRSY